MTYSGTSEEVIELLSKHAGARKLLADLLIRDREEGYGADTIWDAYNNRGYRQALDIVYQALETGLNTPELLMPALEEGRKTAATVCENFRRKGFMEGLDAVRRAISEYGISADEIRTTIQQYRAEDDARKITEEALINFYKAANSIHLRI